MGETGCPDHSRLIEKVRKKSDFIPPISMTKYVVEVVFRQYLVNYPNAENVYYEALFDSIQNLSFHKF